MTFPCWFEFAFSTASPPFTGVVAWTRKPVCDQSHTTVRYRERAAFFPPLPSGPMGEIASILRAGEGLRPIDKSKPLTRRFAPTSPAGTGERSRLGKNPRLQRVIFAPCARHRALTRH